MYAIITIGGNQYRVEPGTELEVDHVDGKDGDAITLPALLIVDDQKHVKVGKEAAGTVVTLTIGSHKLGKKIDVSRFRHKVRHRRHVGVRPHLTVVTVETIGDSKKTANVVPQVAKKAKLPKVAKSK